jgi:hypothetical protein
MSFLNGWRGVNIPTVIIKAWRLTPHWPPQALSLLRSVSFSKHLAPLAEKDIALVPVGIADFRCRPKAIGSRFMNPQPTVQNYARLRVKSNSTQLFRSRPGLLCPGGRAE